MSFKDKVVLVSGASSGIGAATAIMFAAEGAKVSLVGRNQNKLNNVAKKCRSPLVLVADVTSDEDAKRIVRETVKHFGQLDILVNNAGVIGLPLSIYMEDAIKNFDQVMAVNLRAPVLLTSLAVPHLVKTKGNIINVSSIAALRVFLRMGFAYSTSKASLDHFTRSVALELSSSGVRVNTVNPGPVKTDIFENRGADKTQIEAAFNAMKSSTSFGRISEPEEIADLILFLASDKAKAITGSSYTTDNGTLLNTGVN